MNSSPAPAQSGAAVGSAPPCEPRPARTARRSLWLIRGDEGYGVRRATLGMADALAGEGVEIAFVTLRAGSFADEVAAAGYPLRNLGQASVPAGVRRRGWRFLVGVGGLVLSSIATQRALCVAIRDFRPDWVHLRINPLILPAGAAGRRTGVAVYWHLPNTIASKLPFRLQAIGYQLLCRWLRVRVVANSRHTAASLGDRFCRVQVLYPGVDANHFSPAAAFPRLQRSDFDLPPSLPVLVIAARLVPDKAQDRVVAAALQLHRQGRMFALLIVGGPVDSPYHRALRDQVKAAHAGALIQLLGPVQDPRPYYQLADVVVNSRTGAEPFGLSVVEAMLMERPVLAYGLGGPAETIVDGTTGWLTAEATVDGYRDGLLRALHDAPNWAAMGRQARLHAQARFSLEQTIATYQRIVAGDARGARCASPVSASS